MKKLTLAADEGIRAWINKNNLRAEDVDSIDRVMQNPSEQTVQLFERFLELFRVYKVDSGLALAFRLACKHESTMQNILANQKSRGRPEKYAVEELDVWCRVERKRHERSPPWPIQNACKLAKISRPTFYRAKENPLVQKCIQYAETLGWEITLNVCSEVILSFKRILE